MNLVLKYLRDPIWQFFGFVATVVLGFAAIAVANPTLVQRWWQAVVIGALALIALAAVLSFRRVIARGLGWARDQGKRVYLRVLWDLVVRPARDHLSVVVAPATGGAQRVGPSRLRDRRRVDEVEPIQLSGATMQLPEELGGVELVRIPAGQFAMGGWRQQPVFLDTYYISKYPITNVQYKSFIEDEGHAAPAHWTGGRDFPAWKTDHPVVGVSWHDARAYCSWLSPKTGGAFRLPTEAEWEKAAQGPDKRTYPWGDEWSEYKCNCAERGTNDTARVGTDSPEGDSRFGVSDMAGNVWEWTSSLYRDLPFDPNDGREDPESLGERVLRGGSFKNTREQVGCAYRIHNQPKATGEEIGFRIAVSVE
ncbi:MAG TPA: SUMF1/EgtB/PvdO family nonheme iron enzyme [Anaerolineae bacterium]|nr:SUMF1/EgtB/PvdO family nonheme iron enzyme [Anaerolineae bacterium]